ncbi:MAG: heavy-metal-associated domain-containing protein [Actinomycetota bacterium]|nr:heavy-metal-associated domain-containing protein [Actinomycetota bacterium]
MSTSTYVVEGMTCGHCVNSVSTELAKVSGVSDVAVDLDTGEVAITSDGPVDDAAVRAAVTEAGFDIRP